MTHRLIYVSKATDPGDLRGILEVSRRNNVADGITGALCLIEESFLQCLEGELPKLQERYRKIARDPRHADVRLLTLEKVERRWFSNWSLALLRWTDETRAIFEFFMPNAAADLRSVDADKAGTLLRALAASSNWSEV